MKRRGKKGRHGRGAEGEEEGGTESMLFILCLAKRAQSPRDKSNLGEPRHPIRFHPITVLVTMFPPLPLRISGSVGTSLDLGRASHDPEVDPFHGFLRPLPWRLAMRPCP
jgi:hypothetical protein